MKVCTEEGKRNAAAYGPGNKAGDENDRIFHVNGKLCHRGIRDCAAISRGDSAAGFISSQQIGTAYMYTAKGRE